MDDEAILRVFCASGAFVPVTDPKAYESFRDGKPLADISPNAELLDEFRQKNEAEFGGMFARHADGRYPSTPSYGKKIWLTYHRHAAAERQSKDLQQIIAENPGLDG